MSLLGPGLGIFPVDVVKGHLDILPPVGVLALVVVLTVEAKAVEETVREWVASLKSILAIYKSILQRQLPAPPPGD